MTRCRYISSAKLSAILPVRSAFLSALFAFIAVTATGCAPVPSTNGTWTGYVVPQTLRTDIRRADVTTYQAASLHIVDGPEIPQELKGQNGWLPAPILVDENGRIIDPGAFGAAGLVKVEGTAARLWGAYAPEDGRTLDYDPPPSEITWVNGVIQVRRATGADGRPLRLYLAKRSTPANTSELGQK